MASNTNITHVISSIGLGGKEFLEGPSIIRDDKQQTHQPFRGADSFIVIREDVLHEERMTESGWLQKIKHATYHRIPVRKVDVCKESDFFKKLFATFNSQELLKTPIARGEKVLSAALLILRYLQGDDLDLDVLLLKSNDIRMVSVLCGDWQVDTYFFKDLFEKWWNKFSTKIRGTIADYQAFDMNKDFSLFLSAVAFDHPKAAMFSSRRIVYASKGRARHDGLPRRDMRAPVCINQQLNAAKARVRSNLQRMLFDIPAGLLEKDCTCSTVAFSSFMTHLNRLKLWPSFDTVAKNLSILDIESKLRNFDFKMESCCPGCQIDYKHWINEALLKCAKNFEGLCLDCMMKEKGGVQDPHQSSKYQEFVKMPGVYGMDSTYWSAGDRLTHGESTWYFSYHAREEFRRFGV